MFPKPIALSLLKESVIQPIGNHGGEDNVGKGYSGLAELKQSFQIAAGAREGHGNARPNATRCPRGIDRCANIVRRVTPSLTGFRRRNLKRDRKELFVVALCAAAKHRYNLLSVRHCNRSIFYPFGPIPGIICRDRTDVTSQWLETVVTERSIGASISAEDGHVSIGARESIIPEDDRLRNSRSGYAAILRRRIRASRRNAR